MSVDLATEVDQFGLDSSPLRDATARLSAAIAVGDAGPAEERIAAYAAWDSARRVAAAVVNLRKRAA